MFKIKNVMVVNDENVRAKNYRLPVLLLSLVLSAMFVFRVGGCSKSSSSGTGSSKSVVRSGIQSGQKSVSKSVGNVSKTSEKVSKTVRKVDLTGSKRVQITPRPAKMTVFEGNFVLGPGAKIVTDAQTKGVGEYLAGLFRKATGYALPVETVNTVESSAGNIYLSVSGSLGKLGAEGYKLNVYGDKVVISAQKPAGVFYGCQSLRQLLPDEIESQVKVSGVKWIMPQVSIEDKPRYVWRGMHLDVGRHFFDKQFIKKYIDLLAYHKMNRFHWHLTEDQGWRLAIKKYPKLTEIGAWRYGEYGKMYPNHEKRGGYYTQEDVKEIVAYAKSRFITVVPEIEMPGHCLAALASYPELSCTGGPFQVGTHWGVYKDVYCAGNDEVFKFLENVLTEVVGLFPGPYIHIGGDECPKVRWQHCPKCQARIKAEGLKDERELQSYFIKRIEDFLQTKHRRIIGWDEILEGGLAPNATVMSWRGTAGGIAAAKAGHDVIMTPGSHCYFDHYQADPRQQPKAIGGYLPLDKVYSYEPTPANLTAAQAKHILGAQGNVWTEYMSTKSYVEFMVIPRIAALSEVLWTPKKLRNWDNFFGRIGSYLKRMGELGYNYYVPAPRGFKSKAVFLKDMTVTIEYPVKYAQVRYTLDGSKPNENSKLYSGPIKITHDTVLQVQAFLPNGKKSIIKKGVFRKQVFLKAKQVGNLSKGLQYKYYEGNFMAMPKFGKLTPAQTGVVPIVEMIPGSSKVNFALEFSGYVKVPVDGVYSFYTKSDDGSLLFVDGKLIVDNNGLHAASEKSGEVALRAGLHSIKVMYFQAGGAGSLVVSYGGGGISKQVIPADVLFH